METQRARATAPEIKRAPLALANVSDAGIFEGYASVFGIIDLGRDRVERGAFRETLQRKPLRNIKMLWQHDAKSPIGSWLDIAEDERGLRVRGQLNLTVAKAREVLALMRDGAVDGLSIGFHARKSYKDPRTGIRNLTAIDLTEISVVTFPMLPQARVSHVKTMSDADAWRTASARLEWRLAASALEMKFVAARKETDVGLSVDGGDASGFGAAGGWRDQPRAPAGTPEGGQWVSTGGERQGGSPSENLKLANLTCDDLFSADLEICRSIGAHYDDRWMENRCTVNAMLRYQECLDGLPLTNLLLIR